MNKQRSAAPPALSPITATVLAACAAHDVAFYAATQLAAAAQGLGRRAPLCHNFFIFAAGR